MTAESCRYRLGIVATHPIQYQGHWFRRLAAHPQLDIVVYYCHTATPQEQAAAGFEMAFEWDRPLLDGYPHELVRNVAKQPTQARFFGLNTPDISRVIRSGRHDAVLVLGWNHLSEWQAIRACWATGTPVLVRGDSHLLTPRSALKRLGKYALYRSFIPRFDACLAVGTWSENYFRAYGATKVFRVPHSVDRTFLWEQHNLALRNRDELRATWQLPKHATTFVFAGKLIGRKRPMDLLRAVDLACNSGVNMAVLMVGDGPLRAECEAFAHTRSLPVRFTGFLNQSTIPGAYTAGDVLVLPSGGEETWGLVVNEAMVCGLPCIVSDRVGAGPDLVRPDETGDIYPVGDVTSLARLLVRYTASQQRVATMGAEAHRHESCFAERQAIDGVIAALESVVARRRERAQNS